MSQSVSHASVIIYFQKTWTSKIITLTLKVPITTAADDNHKYFFHRFSEKIKLDVSSESFSRQRIHMKNQAQFSSKDKSKKLKCRLLQFLFGALGVNCPENGIDQFNIAEYAQKLKMEWQTVVDPDLTAPLGAVRSGSALFAQPYLVQY